MNPTSLRRLALALGTVAVALSLSVPDGHAAKIRKGTTRAELPPAPPARYAVGDRTVWQDKKQGKFSAVVTAVKGGVVSWKRTDGCRYSVSTETWQAPPTRWKNCFGSSGTAKVSRKGKSRLYPLKVGNTETFKVRGKSRSAGKTNTWSNTRHCKVEGTASVTVPAGRFDTYHIVCSDKWTRYEWYHSPKLRFNILYRQVPRKGSSGSRQHQELVSYEPAGS